MLSANVRFWVNSGYQRAPIRFLLLTQNGPHDCQQARRRSQLAGFPPFDRGASTSEQCDMCRSGLTGSSSLTGRYMRWIALALAFSLCGTPLAFAQEVPVIGWITPSTTESFQQTAPGSPGPGLLREMLTRHGLIDGKTVRLDARLAEGRLERLPALAEELVRDGATVILASEKRPGARHKPRPKRFLSSVSVTTW